MTERSTGQPGAQVDLTRLTSDQLAEVRKQLDAELDHLSGSFRQLRQARQTFVGCAEAVMQAYAVDAHGKAIQAPSVEEEKEILVPLTSSLYVPGRLLKTQPRRRDPDGLEDALDPSETAEPAQVTVDIGTGYYLSKSPAEALAFYKDKCTALDRNLQELEKIIGAKAQNLQLVTEVYAEKMRQAQQQETANSRKVAA